MVVVVAMGPTFEREKSAAPSNPSRKLVKKADLWLADGNGMGIAPTVSKNKMRSVSVLENDAPL